MIEQQKNNPLHGVKLEAMLTELALHYGFDILAEQINLNCFKVNSSVKSSLKFLRKTPWARDKVEAFYLYKYKGLPKPSDEQHELPPRERLIGEEQTETTPTVIELGEGEFFDDPASGRKPVSNMKHKPERSRADSRAVQRVYSQPESAASFTDSSELKEPSSDPWAKWKEKNKEES